MPAYYQCKLCDGSHPLPGDFPTRELFDGLPVHRHVCTCPRVERGAIYRKSDVFWREGQGYDPPPDGRPDA